MLAALVLVAGAASAQAGLADVYDPPRGDVRLVVLGDFNGPYGSVEYPAGVARAMAVILAVWRPDLVVSPGDVIAGQSRDLPADRFAAMWAAFDATVAGPLRADGVPYAFAPGNHDASSLRSGGQYVFERERGAAEEYWSAHVPGLDFRSRSAYPFDYSFTYSVSGRDAGLFVAILDASSSAVTAGQRSWLAAELSSPAAVAAAARIVVGHLPLVPVSQGRDRPGEYVFEGEALGATMAAGSVDLYVSGHHAAYYPGRLGELELLFAGGVGGRRLLGSSAEPRSTVTVVDLWFGAQETDFRYTTYDLATLGVVDPSSLPAAIGAVVLSRRAGRGAVADLGEEQ